MANELTLLPNPDNVPGDVSTGYQRQNTNLFAVQTGLDTISPINNGSSVIIQAGGIIEVNGSLFKVITNVNLSKSTSSIYWVAVRDNGDNTASFYLSDSQGTWNQAKQGYYLPNGARTSKWNTSDVPSGNEGVLTYTKNTKGNEIISLPEGKYRAVLRSGKGEGNAQEYTGGIANKYHEITIFFYHDGNRQLQIRIGGDGFNGGNGFRSYVSAALSIYGAGSGAGEETEIVGIAKTNRIKAGKSGEGNDEGIAGLGGHTSGRGEDGLGTTGERGEGGGKGFGGGSNGNNGTYDGSNTIEDGTGGGSGGRGGRFKKDINTNVFGGGSNYGSNGDNYTSNAASRAASGAGGGAPGWQRPEGHSSAGYCNIYRL